ncbi:PEPxxWA-CTERM sorting domain-containing protein [Sphingosinicellaceae bacterium]|nr:PEPxxWA-CTERM sorting domain-containing protein [Sphingosinicellaceae bacterium]
MKLPHILLPALAFLAAAAAPAGAVTYIVAPGAPDPGKLATETTFFTFDSAPTAGFSYSGNYDIVTGTSKNHYAAPAGDTTAFFYTSPEKPNGVATLNTLDLSTVSFYWGSVDDYNTVDVLGAGGATLTSINGADFSPANGGQDTAHTNERIYITAGANEVITGLRFHATGIAYEIDDVAGTLANGSNPSTVPEPASWALMVAGFGLVGVGARRRRGATMRVSA